MLQQDAKKLVEATQRQLVIMWPAFVSTVVICLFIPQVIDSVHFPADGNFGSGTLRAPLWFVSLVVLGILWWWNRQFLTKEAILKRVGEGQGMAPKVLRSYLLRKIIAFALAEAIAIYGLVLAIIGSYLWDQYVLSAVSGLAFIFLYPSRTFLDELIEGYETRVSS